MADLIFLPSTTYHAPSPTGRSRGASLNTIIEECEDSHTPHRHTASRRANGKQSAGDVEQWLSPLSDHFPTPRGFHFLAAPIVPSTPSAVSEAEDRNADETSSETSSNSSVQMWNNRESAMTDSTASSDLDSASDASDGGETRKGQLRANGIARSSGFECSRSSWRASRTSSLDLQKALARLDIPADRDSSSSEVWSEPPQPKKTESPIPPTPPSRVELPPVQLAFMQAQQHSEVPTISTPPSLDGSLGSEELAAMSAPPTPLIGAGEDHDRDWAGVQLQPGALATLNALSGGDENPEMQPEEVIEVPPEEMSESRRQPPPRLTTDVAPAPVTFSPPQQQRSLGGLTKLEIPSPGGFFCNLSSASRSTWTFSNLSADNVAPPTSTTAEQFYKAPWNPRSDSLPAPPPRPLHIESTSHPSSVVERVVEISPEALEDPPTAFRIQPTPEPTTARKVLNSTRAAPSQETTSGSHTAAAKPSSPVDATEIVVDYDPEYARQQQEAALSHLDRTERWLMAQRAYLGGVLGPSKEKHEKGHEKDEKDEKGDKEVATKDDGSDVGPEVPPKDIDIGKIERKLPPPQKKKTVRFSEVVEATSIPKELPSKLFRQESAYYRAFTDLIIRSHRADCFVHRLPRFEAIQAQRISLRDAHRDQLLGKYQLSVIPQSAKKRMSSNVARGDDVLADDPDRIRIDKEHEALAQMSSTTWHVAATKMLNSGQLVTAPIAKRLARQSRMPPGPDGVSRDRARILDLGGQGTCDWAWYAALAFPNTKVYTVTTKAIRQLSNSNVRGPPNHRQVAVDALSKLPFPDAQFDLISARELHSILKLVGENGEDEWEACLAECMRVLKPGGYLEFILLDSDIMNAGPLGLARSVELGFTLQTLGYDPAPTRTFLGRLRRTGFEAVRRAWVCLPVGPKPKSAAAAARAPAPRDPKTGLPVSTVELEAMVSGGADDAAAVTGLVAGWSWERWVLRTEMEKAAGELRLADTVTAGDKMREAAMGIRGVHGIVEEGRARGAAFRLLKGYARKPRATVGIVGAALDAGN